MGNVLIGLGVLLILGGIVWLLQGLGVLPGSVMSGQSFWAWAGLFAILAGGLLAYFGYRRRTRA
jgi:LPXTG-motif cell wall-anchored protein